MSVLTRNDFKPRRYVPMRVSAAIASGSTSAEAVACALAGTAGAASARASRIECGILPLMILSFVRKVRTTFSRQGQGPGDRLEQLPAFERLVEVGHRRARVYLLAR